MHPRGDSSRSRRSHVWTDHTMRSVVVGLSWTRTCPRSTSRPRSGRHVGHRLLLHPRHGPLPLHGHLQVLRQRLTASQHLVGHDLSPELVQLVLVKGGWSSCTTRSRYCTRRSTWTLRTPTVRLTHSLVWVSAAFHRTRSRARGGSRHHGTRGRATGWDRAGGMLRASQRRGVTLGVLVHRAWRRSHPAVPSWSHGHALHLAVAGIIRHSLLMHGFHGFVHLMHVVLRIS